MLRVDQDVADPIAYPELVRSLNAIYIHGGQLDHIARVMSTAVSDLTPDDVIAMSPWQRRELLHEIAQRMQAKVAARRALHLMGQRPGLLIA